MLTAVSNSLSLLSRCQSSSISALHLPNPTGPLCELSSPAIAAANAAVNNLQPRGVGAKKRGSYMKLDEIKIKIGKYSSENGVSAAARHF